MPAHDVDGKGTLVGGIKEERTTRRSKFTLAQRDKLRGNCIGRHMVLPCVLVPASRRAAVRAKVCETDGCSSVIEVHPPGRRCRLPEGRRNTGGGRRALMSLEQTCTLSVVHLILRNPWPNAESHTCVCVCAAVHACSAANHKHPWNSTPQKRSI